MADAIITALTAYTTPIATDVLPIVDVTANVTKKIAYSDLSSKIIGTLTAKAGLTSHDASSTTTLVIAHGLGRTPVKINFIVSRQNSAFGTSTEGVYTSSYQGSIGWGNSQRVSSSTYGVYYVESNGPEVSIGGVVSVDGTNITITWTKSASPSTTFDLLWSAI